MEPAVPFAFPAAHCVQLPEPVVESVPTGQFKQTDDPAVLYFPAAQSEHIERPAVDAIFPPGQAAQEVARSLAEIDPGGH